MTAELRRLARATTAAEKLALLSTLARARLPTAKEVERLHEALLFLRAFPDDAAVLARSEQLLRRFAARRDLRRHARALQDTGIAGTAITFPFFAPTATWLARHWPAAVDLDWDAIEDEEKLERVLPLLALFAETPGLDEVVRTPREWLEHMAGKGETPGAFLLSRLGALGLGGFVHEYVLDGLGLQFVLRPAKGTPARTLDRARAAPGSARLGLLPHGRPDLRRLAPPLSIREVGPAEGRELVELARRAMVTRSRDLDAFMHGDPRDVRMVECGEGLAFAVIGVRPERRLLLEAVYAFLTLRNGVPIGYVLVSALNRSSEVAYNVFETYRGVGSAWVYGRALATTRALFGSDTFTVYPYQLGDENEEAIESGAWWFYRKLGFEPRDAGARRLMRSEERRGGRSSAATLRRLARHNVFLTLDRQPVRPDAIGIIDLPAVGLRVTALLAARAGSARGEEEGRLADEARRRLGLRSLAGWTAGERQAWSRWAPVLALVQGLERWPAAERRAAVQVVRAKGGPRESEFVRLFDRHRRLRAALRRLAHE